MKEFKFTYGYDLIDDYKYPENLDDWEYCPVCGLKPKIWTFDNGRSTGCGCHNSKYEHRAIVAESIMSVVKRCNGSSMEYDSDELRKNWNIFCTTGVETVLQEGRW